jgi:hypothetical protein
VAQLRVCRVKRWCEVVGVGQGHGNSGGAARSQTRGRGVGLGQKPETEHLMLGFGPAMRNRGVGK